MSIARQANAWLAWLIVAAILVQVWLAGAAIPQLGGNGNFVNHQSFGYLIGLLFLVQLVVAVLARPGRRTVGIAAGLLVLYVIQSSLPYMDPGLPAVAALHPVNALVMFGVQVWYARQAWRDRAVATV
jgi:uncharacterized protein DUF6220